ncbi:transposase, partial [Paraglaciecola aquimarina]
MASQYHLSEVLQRFLPNYQQLHALNYRQSLVCQHIAACHTAKLGMQQWQCDRCEFQKIHYCSYRDRHCPRCQGQKSQEWIAKQQAQVINGPYFHLVFTLPHELNVISQYADKALYRALFQAVWQTLSQFAANRKQLKGQLGITTVLHTWGQTLSQHIHLHCLVPGGVLTKEGKWITVKKAYLFPVKALSQVFKGKMLQALRAESVALPRLDAVINKPWCVYSKACLARPETVIKYLARYTQKGMLHESRIKHISQDDVTFSYKDYRQPTQQKTMTLSGVEF